METALHRIKSRAGRACRNERLLAAVERVNDARRSGLPDPYTDPRDARALARLLAVRAKESTPDAVRVGPDASPTFDTARSQAGCGCGGSREEPQMAESMTGVAGAIEGQMQWRYVAVPSGDRWMIRDLWIDTARRINEAAKEYPAVGLTEASARAWLAQKDGEERADYRRQNPPCDCACGCDGDVERHR